MRRHLIFLCAFAFTWFEATAQLQTPAFIMPFWFEDAVGNKDTIWVGADNNATSGNNFDMQFGEVPIYSPFDSVFEVRAISQVLAATDWIGSKINIDRLD